MASWDFGGNGSTPIPWGPCYCVVIVLLLCCYCRATLLLLCCYCRATLLLLCCYCVVIAVLACCCCRATVLFFCCYFVFLLLLCPSHCIAGHCALHLHLVVFVSYQLAHKRGWIVRTRSCSAYFARSTANGCCIAHAQRGADLAFGCCHRIAKRAFQQLS